MIALAAAIVLGLIAVFVANAYLTGRERQVDVSGTSKVAVAAVPLSYGTDITPDKVKFVDYPRSSIPPGAFMNQAQLLPEGKQRFALMTIGINEPVLASKISGAGQGASIAALLTEGMRAATVRIDDVSGVAGFVQPNDSVDVLITRTLPNEGNQKLTDVLLQNVRVLAIDQEAKNSDGTPKLARSATFEVAPLDAQKLALGQQAGSLSLVLRRPGETNNPVVETVSLNDLRYNMYGGARYPAPAVVGGFGAATPVAQVSRPRAPARRVAAKKPAPPKPSIEVYRGTTSNEYKVGGYGG
ncbi:MAG: Flp pilus assembly protein CpaB [Sphingomicrobium sp.]